MTTADKDRTTSGSKSTGDKTTGDKSSDTSTRELSQMDVGGESVESSADDEEFGVAYQRAGQIRQGLAELRLATAHGNEDRQRAARKNLEAQGFDVEAHEARQKRKSAKASDKDTDASRQPPEGRSATPPSQVRTDAPTAKTAPASAPSKPGVSVPLSSGATVTTTTDVTTKPEASASPLPVKPPDKPASK